MTMAQDFTAHAGDEAWIVNFFKTHIVMVAYIESQNHKRVHNMGVLNGWVTYGFDTGFAGRTDTGAPMPVVTIANEPGLVDTFQSYWCPYRGNDSKHAYLRRAAPYMFTAKMDGCTFGVGMPSSQGSVRVAHCNEGGRGSQQLTTLQTFFSTRTHPLRTTFGPSSYRLRWDDLRSTMATTFGILVGTAWKFFAQISVVDPNLHTLTFVGLVEVG